MTKSVPSVESSLFARNWSEIRSLTLTHLIESASPAYGPPDRTQPNERRAGTAKRRPTQGGHRQDGHPRRRGGVRESESAGEKASQECDGQI